MLIPLCGRGIPAVCRYPQNSESTVETFLPDKSGLRMTDNFNLQARIYGHLDLS
jgi:hypothetical protein